MKNTKSIIPVAALAVAALFTSCSDNSAPVGEPKVVEIHASDNMKFDVTEIQVKPGQPVKVTLKNIGTMPKESMGHNFVVLTTGVDMTEFLTAAATQARNAYVPPQFASKVLAHTKLLGPGESDTVTFTAPKTPGKYDFLCSFPGHAPAGMKGFLIVN
ncbi:MAG: azurin [Chthoniobacterales bacterium]|nr:azurin [Chthoniobacterales bacterium]